MPRQVDLSRLIECIVVSLQLILRTSAALLPETLPTPASTANRIVFRSLSVNSGVFHETDRDPQHLITEVSVWVITEQMCSVESQLTAVTCSILHSSISTVSLQCRQNLICSICVCDPHWLLSEYVKLADFHQIIACRCLWHCDSI